MADKERKKTNKKIIIIIAVILAAVLAGVIVFIATRPSSYQPSASPAYSIPALPADMSKEASDKELERLAAFKEPETMDASERHQYDIKVAINEFTDDYAYAMMALHETVAFKNTTGQELDRISLRDYAQCWIEEAKAIATADITDPFDKDTEIFNVKNAVSGAELNAVRDENDNSIIYIDLDKPVKDGEQITVSFDFTAPMTQTGLRGNIAEIGNDKYAMDLCNFYPILSEWKDGSWVNHPDIPAGECFFKTCSDYNVTVSAPEGWTVIATGDEKEGKTADGYTTWTCTASQVRDFAMTVSNGYDFVEKTSSTGVKTRFWYYKDGAVAYDLSASTKKSVDYTFYKPDINGYDDGNSASTDHFTYEKLVNASVDYAVKALELFDKKIGKYAYDSMDVVISSLGRDFYAHTNGMEYPQYVIVSERLVSNEYRTECYNHSIYSVIAHEIGHNWFYGIAGNDEYLDTWIDEGLTSVLEYIFGDEYNIGETKSGKELAYDEGKKKKSQIDLPAGNYGDKEYGIVVYQRAAYFMFEVRDAIGEEKFYDMLSEYYNTYYLKEATTEQFIEIAEKYISDNAKAQKLFKTYLSRY